MKDRRKLQAFVAELRSLLEGSGKIESTQRRARLWGVLVGIEQIAASPEPSEDSLREAFREYWNKQLGAESQTAYQRIQQAFYAGAALASQPSGPKETSVEIGYMTTGMAKHVDGSIQEYPLHVGSAPQPANDLRAKLEALRAKADRAYCDMVDQSRREECLGYAAKLKDGSFGEKELEAHSKMREFLGMHTAYADAAALASQPSGPKETSVDVPLCGNHAEWWFCERNHLPQPNEPCVVCAMLPASDLRAKLESLRDYYKGDLSGVMVPSSGVVKRITDILEGK